MINLEDLEVLKGKPIYNTSSDTYVLYEKNEKTVNSVDFKLLGCLHGYSYSYNDHYLSKSTLEQIEIAKILVDVEVGVFDEDFSFAYFYKDNIIYQITEDLEINWSKSFDDDIREVIMDNYGSIYLLFKNSRVIRKFTSEGEYILYLNESDNPSRYTRLYSMYISEGCGHLYVIGSEFWNNRVLSFIDHYNTRKCKRIDRQILYEYNNVALDDEYFTFKDIYIDGDYVYIYANNYIEKSNLKLRKVWRYDFGYNYITRTSDCLTKVVFDDNKFKDRIFFCENLASSGGYSFGKLSTNGNLLWKITYPENIEKTEFNICIYRSDIYLTTKRNVTSKTSYVLSLDDNRVLFETQDGNLIRIVENNYDEIYSPENYIGMYLIGDSIKDGITKTIMYNLLHDTGEIITEDGYTILLEEENKNYRNPDNYDYFKLIGSEVTDDPNDHSYIQTLDNKFLTTSNGSYIETLYPYLPNESYQYIINHQGALMVTDDDKNLIRSKARYISEFYLLADEHKFSQELETKKEGKVIITKDKEYTIIRKARYVYRYVIKRLMDIDIIVEHLKENGILETLIPHYVDRLRHNRTRMIKDIQKALSPTYFNLESTKRYGYKYDGYDYPLRTSKTQMFLCKNLPYINNHHKKSIYIESLSTLINNEEMTPFMLFLNGKAIKWSDITVVRDWFFSYLIISNNSDESDKLEAVMFPCVIRYGEDNAILPNCKTGLYFDTFGKYTEDINKIRFRIEVLDKDVVGSRHTVTMDNSYIKFEDIEYNQLTDNNNVFSFENGYFFGDSRFYLDFKGKNIYTYARDLSSTDVVLRTFYFDKANESKNMMFAIPNQDESEKNIIEGIDNETLQPTDDFLIPFDYTLTFDKSYLTNISEATKYILTYRMQLLVDYYRDQSNIKSYSFDGERILTLASKNGGYLVMPRQRKNGLHDYIMVFKNDHLYEYYQEIEYENRVFKIPIFSHITRYDKLEVIHFKNVDNSYSSLTVTDSSDYISEELRHDNFLLFGNSYSGKTVYDTFDIEKCKQFTLEFDYKNHFNDYGKYVNTMIQLKDQYYSGKKINICSKQQFHQMYYNVLIDNQDEFELEPEFRFCHNSNQYMIFVNNKKLNADEWIFKIMNNDNDLDIMSLVLDIPLKKNDVINIFYLPLAYEEIVLENHTNSVGDIIMDVSQLDYPFDNELFLIFVDGHKILSDDIQNISSDRIRIKTSVPLKSNVCVCKYLNPDKLLQKIFSYGDIWTRSVNSLTTDEYEKLFVRAKK